MEYYTVQPEDTISSIALKFGLTESGLCSLNNLQSNPPAGSRILIRSPELSLSNEVFYFTRLGRVRGTLTITEHVMVFDPLSHNNTCELLTDKGKTLADSSNFQAFIDLNDVIHFNIIDLQGTVSSRSTDQVFIIEVMLSRTGREKRGKRSEIPKINVHFKLANLLSNGESLQFLQLKTKTDQMLALVLSTLPQLDRNREDSGTFIPFYEINKGYLGRLNSGLIEEDENEDEEFKECIRDMMESQEQQQESFVMPEVQIKSKLLTERMTAQVHWSLPGLLHFRTWELFFATYLHGRSLSTFYVKNERIGPNILIVKDSNGYVFGGYFSSAWRSYNRSYGSGECFVFTFRDSERLKIFFSTLSNDSYMLSDNVSLIVGGGGQPSIYLDKYFETGNSGKSRTFNNQVLSSDPHFQVLEVELWGLI